MISVKLEGRLGNQLFQYAFIYSTAKKLRTRFYVDKRIENFILPRYFEVPQEKTILLDEHLFKISGFKHLFCFHLKWVFYKTLQKTFRLKDIYFSNEVDPNEELKKVNDYTAFNGFFQSEKYFKHYSSDIKGFYSIKPHYKKQFHSIRTLLNTEKPWVTIHIRKGDYLTLNLNLDGSYYHDAIKLVQNEDYHYIFISDDPNSIAAEFDYLKDKYISNNSEIIDFQFLMHADVCILSNSSFSWWGAYLNEKNAKVIAPKYWLGKSESPLPHSILMENWIKL